MGDYARDIDARFVLGIGDNMVPLSLSPHFSHSHLRAQYDTGVSSVDDPQFETKFEKTFDASSLRVPWYLVGGNHDYYGSIGAQIEYSEKSERWNFPDFYYTQYIEEDGVSLTVVAIDTWRLNGGDTYVSYNPVTKRGFLRDHERLKRDRMNGVVTEGTYSSITKNFPAEKSEESVQDSEQLAHIERWLNNSNSTWTIVVGHFPVYSATVNEHGDTASLVEHLEPLLSKYKVHAYFSGHDHVLQHIQKKGVSYFGSGAGARQHVGMNTSYDSLVAYSQGKYGFMTHKLTAESFTTTFVVNDGNGHATEPYSFTINH